MKLALLDANYLVALEIDNDQYHLKAVSHWRQALTAEPCQFVVTSFVFDEVVTFLNNRRKHARAVEIGNRLLNSVFIRFVHVDASLLRESWSYFQKHQDKTYSLTDCISFVLMQQLGIRTAFTFDQHFRQAGFETEP